MSLWKMVHRRLTWVAQYRCVPGLGFIGSSDVSVTTYMAPFFPPEAAFPNPLAQSAKACRFEAHFGFHLQQESIMFMAFFWG